MRPWQIVYRLVCLAHTLHNVCFNVMLAISGKHATSKKNTHNSDLAIRMEKAGPALARRALAQLVVPDEDGTSRPLTDWLAVWAVCIETRWGTSVKVAEQYLKYREVLLSATTLTVCGAMAAGRTPPSAAYELYQILSSPTTMLQLLVYHSLMSRIIAPFIKWAQGNGGRRAGEVHELVRMQLQLLSAGAARPKEQFPEVRSAVGTKG